MTIAACSVIVGNYFCFQLLAHNAKQITRVKKVSNAMTGTIKVHINVFIAY